MMDGDNNIYEGIYIEMIVGIGSPNADFDFENGAFTGWHLNLLNLTGVLQVRVLGGGKLSPMIRLLLMKELQTVVWRFQFRLGFSSHGWGLFGQRLLLWLRWLLHL